MDRHEQLSILQRDLRSVFGDRLASLVAYEPLDGPRPAAGHGQGHGPTRRLHTLVIVDKLGEPDLRHCAAHVARWHDAGCATPLLLAAHEFERALDAFPLEFGAIMATHVVVAGRNPFEGLQVNEADLRQACEVQARSHLLHLREGYVEAQGNGDALAVLLVRSAPAFSALMTIVARLDGHEAADASASARHVERMLRLDPHALEAIVGLTGVPEISGAQAVKLSAPYLEAVERLVHYIDTWRRPA
jgi:hypothetical protein